MRRRPGLRSVVATLLVALLLASCGGGDTGETTQAEKTAKPKLLPGQVSLDETVFECLTEVGAFLAIAPRDIAFFRKAKATNDVVQVGEEHDRRDGVIVRLLASKRGGTKEWMLWYSQPSSSSLDPESIVRQEIDPNVMGFSPEEHPYVAFEVKPREYIRREIHRCVEFPLAMG